MVVYGGTSTSHQREQVRKGANVLIATPGRLLQFVDEGIVKFDKLRSEGLFVVLSCSHVLNMYRDRLKRRSLGCARIPPPSL